MLSKNFFFFCSSCCGFFLEHVIIHPSSTPDQSFFKKTNITFESYFFASIASTTKGVTCSSCWNSFCFSLLFLLAKCERKLKCLCFHRLSLGRDRGINQLIGWGGGIPSVLFGTIKNGRRAYKSKRFVYKWGCCWRHFEIVAGTCACVHYRRVAICNGLETAGTCLFSFFFLLSLFFVFSFEATLKSV